MISGAAGLGLWDRVRNIRRIIFKRGTFLDRSISESFPRLAPICGDVVGFRGAKETDLLNKCNLLDNPPDKEAPNVALGDSGVALQ